VSFANGDRRTRSRCTVGRGPARLKQRVGFPNLGDQLAQRKPSRIFANWTSFDELRTVVRHEAAHLAFARTHTVADSAGHAGPSEDFALAFEAGVSDEEGQSNESRLR
jgi:hypothetical protein